MKKQNLNVSSNQILKRSDYFFKFLQIFGISRNKHIDLKKSRVQVNERKYKII